MKNYADCVLQIHGLDPKLKVTYLVYAYFFTIISLTPHSRSFGHTNYFAEAEIMFFEQEGALGHCSSSVQQ